MTRKKLLKKNCQSEYIAACLIEISMYKKQNIKYATKDEHVQKRYRMAQKNTTECIKK